MKVSDRMNEKTEDIFLSLVVPVYNVEPWIERCIQSILSDPLFEQSCELIIVDDGSEDASILIVERLCKGKNNVQLVRQKNKGLSAARNIGAAHVRGLFLWFIDSDDWLPPLSISRLIAFCQNNPVQDVISFAHVKSSDTCSSKNLDLPTMFSSGLEILEQRIVDSPVQFYAWSTHFYRKENLQFEDGIYHEDALFTPTALCRAPRVALLPETFYVYNVRPNSIMTSGNKLRHARDMIVVVNRLDQFRLSMSENRRAQKIISRYCAFAIGGFFHYFWQLEISDRLIYFKHLDALKFAKLCLTGRRIRYILHFLRLWLEKTIFWCT